MSFLPKNVGLGIGILAGSAVLMHQTTFVRNFPSTRFGAEIWPQIVIGIIGVLALVMILNGWRKRNYPDAAAAHGMGGKLGGRDVIALGVFASFGFFVYAVPLIGTPLAGFVMVMAILSFIGEPRPRMIMIHTVIALASVGLMWIIFTNVLKVIMPTGTLW
ncbi:tripartite tricarboxylate transporter TctB family protein [Primorskyibacter flagellatus]|uniref:tripartite tricarboxylate transporter TctB family protein n=1 Tax=Primorskyibacter flagellatus TaxID=1387277 RepID=UPI003A94DA44